MTWDAFTEDAPLREYPLGDRTIVLELAEEISVAATVRVTAFAEAFQTLSNGTRGIEEVQPTYTGVAVHFDPRLVSPSYLRGLLYKALDLLGRDGSGSLLGRRTEPGEQSVMEVPVLYGGDAGPDLADSARRLGLSPEELIRRHCAREYLVHMIGFTPGFPYLGTLDPSISLPRLETPRTSVPQGSVGIAREQTGIYSIPAPGGWRIIGRTPLKVFSPDRDKPFLFEPGMRVKFRPITRQEFARLAEQDRAQLWENDRQHDREHEREKERKQDGRRAWDRTGNTVLSRPTGQRNIPAENAVPALVVQSPGFFSTVQDLGRKGFRKYGVPLSGAADPVSLIRGNLLVGNPPGAAGIEMTYSGAAFLALLDVPVAVTGAPAEVTIDGHPVDMWKPLVLRKSSILEIGALSKGARTYLAVAGGIQTPISLGSRSTYVRASLGGIHGRPLREGDVLEVGPHPALPWLGSKDIDCHALFPGAGEEVWVRVIPGPEPAVPGTGGATAVGPEATNVRGEELQTPPPGARRDPEILENLTSSAYRVSSSSDRMGLRLEGPALVSGETDIISGTVVPGVVQVGSDGLPMVLLADGQTTGGYWRIASVISADLPVLGQVRPGTIVRFRVVDYDVALQSLSQFLL
ncbi:MAG TPA: 5-oxoprolinase subunit PxpB [Firmicutes bacterium]|nr:5-oxoprolinase subunit PxpB [Candidatus Fermentithermobacillaceae bacterium]